MKSLNHFLLIALVICFFSCEKKEVKMGELLPPQWIQGEWNVQYGSTYFEFTSANITFALPNGSISSFSKVYKSESYVIEETIKTDEIYEITVTQNNSSKIYKFKKGDDETCIEYYLFDTSIEGGLANDAIYILHKK